MGKFRQFFTELSAHNTTMAGYYSLAFLLCFFVQVFESVLILMVFFVVV